MSKAGRKCFLESSVEFRMISILRGTFNRPVRCRTANRPSEDDGGCRSSTHRKDSYLKNPIAKGRKEGHSPTNEREINTSF